MTTRKFETGRGADIEMDSYKSTLDRWDGERQNQEFDRLSDAILWATGELNAGHGHAIYGEIHFREKLLWRRGTRPAKKDSDDQAPSGQ